MHFPAKESKEAFDVIYKAICGKYGQPSKNAIGTKRLMEPGPVRYEQFDTTFTWKMNSEMVCVMKATLGPDEKSIYEDSDLQIILGYYSIIFQEVLAL